MVPGTRFWKSSLSARMEVSLCPSICSMAAAVLGMKGAKKWASTYTDSKPNRMMAARRV